MIFFNDPGGVLHDLVHGLYHAVRGQAAVLHAQVHAAPAAVHTDAQFISGGKLGAQQVAGVGGEHIVVVKAGGASVLHQLAHARQRGQADDFAVQDFPYLIEGFQPVKQFHILHLGQVAGKDLIQMMVGVHQAGIAQHVGAVNSAVGLGIEVRTDFFDSAGGIAASGS